MRRYKFKLLYSFFGVIFTAVTLTSTTFAWFANNKEAWIDEFEIELRNTDNLMISVDGINYRSSIPNDLLKRAIVAKKLNKELNDESLTDLLVNQTFNKIGLDAVTTSDLVNFKNIDKSTVAIDDKVEYYPLTEADSYSYITFDLWFKMSSTQASNKNYKLKFVSDSYAEANNTKVSYVESTPTTVFLFNELKTIPSLDKRTGVRNSGIYEGLAYEAGSYLSGDTIVANAKDAIRIGITNEENVKTIYEPSIGLGSYAIKKYEDTTIESMDIYDPNKNAMYTYFNKINEAKIEPITSNEDLYTTTQKDFNGDISFDTFKPNADFSYDEVKLTVAVWIEAYDADYLVGMQNGSIKLMLNFCVEEE